MRTLILGVDGPLGSELHEAFRSLGHIVACASDLVDVTRLDALFALIQKHQPELVLNALDYGPPDACEDNLEQASLVNESAAGYIAEIAHAAGAPVVYVSTAEVFDGKRETPYLPSDATAPINVFGRTKAAGENATRQANPLHLIVRLSWLYGDADSALVDRVWETAEETGGLRAADDFWGNPSHASDMADAVLRLVKGRHYGIHHLANGGHCSQYAFVRAVLDLTESTACLDACEKRDLPAGAPRPAHAVLDCSPYTEATGHRLRTWQQALMAFVEAKSQR